MGEEKKRILLTVAYDGTRYSGWQIQPNGTTIEGELIRAIRELTGEEVLITGASRTDAGVHALCNKAVFDTTARMPAEKFSYALNTHLPEDIRVLRSEEVEADFHPRKRRSEKTYEYRIWNAAFPDPQSRLYSCFIYDRLDLEKMKAAARYLIGTHDFAAFSTYKPEVQSTVRTISDIRLWEEQAKFWQGEKREGGSGPRMILLRVTGNGFLYHMVRIIAGTLMEVGRGRLEPEDVERILLSEDRNQAGPTAPACGLTMVDHRFWDETVDETEE